LRPGGDAHPLYSNLPKPPPAKSGSAARYVGEPFTWSPALGDSVLGRAASAAVFEGDCLFLIGDRTQDDNAPKLFGRSLAAMGALGTSLGLSTTNASTARDLQNKIREAINGPRHCKDVIVFLAGHGSPAVATPLPDKPDVNVQPTAEPTVSLGTFPLKPGANPVSPTVTSTDLHNIMGEYANRPDIRFKLMIFSCFSGRFVTALEHEPNLAVISTSSSATEYSWSYISSGRPGGFGAASGPTLENPTDDPRQLPGYVFGMVGQLQAIIESPTSFDSYGGDMAKIIYAAAAHEGSGDFTAQLGWTHPQEYLAPAPPAPPTPPIGPIGPVEFGSDLSKDPETIARATVDFVLWAVQQATASASRLGAFAASASGPAVPAAGQVTKVTVRGSYVLNSCPVKPDSVCQENVHFQDLRPQSNGELKIISTTQAFTLPSTPGTYSFEPTNFFVEAGDYVGLATVGGEFRLLVPATGAQTDMFQGHEKDMNGDLITSNNTLGGQELDMRVTLQPKS
jgi:hypothetical protein